MELVDFIKARLDEDEAAAQLVEASWPGETITRVLAGPEHYALMQHDVSPTRAAHIARHDPARVLAEVAAKRAIIGLFCLEFDEYGSPITLGGYGEAYWDTLRYLAVIWADHPDYDPAWAPEEATQAAPKSRPAVICGPVLPAPLVPPDQQQEQRPDGGEHGGRHSEKPI